MDVSEGESHTQGLGLPFVSRVDLRIELPSESEAAGFVLYVKQCVHQRAMSRAEQGDMDGRQRQRS